MKKNLFYIPLVALAMASCSENDLGERHDQDQIDDNGSSYITINIVNSTDKATRDDSDPSADPTTGGSYENGLPIENGVKSVTFFFFNANGTVAPVKGNGDYFFTPAEIEEATSSTGDDNVEKIMRATIVIDSTNGDLLPAGIVAILNPSTELLAALEDKNTIKDIDDFYQVMDYKYDPPVDNGDYYFLMSNSVYVDGDKHIRATYVSPDKYHPKSQEAIEDPVNIYVERVLAKVRVGNTISFVKDASGNNTAFYDTGVTYTKRKYDKDGNLETSEGQKKIYVKLYDWNTTATTDKSHLIKKINSAWDSNIFQKSTEPWNNPDRFRSFWAVNPDNVGIDYFDFDNAGKFEFTGTNWTYIQENAAESINAGSITKTPSDVIIAGQLFDEDGKELGLADVGGIYYVVDYDNHAPKGNTAKTSKDGEITIKQAILSYLKSASMLWDVTELLEEGEGTKTAKEISWDDVKIFTGTQMQEQGITNAKEYKVYIQLDPSNNKKWSFKSSDVTANDVLSTDDVNEVLYELGGAKVWTAGLTYYYFPIRHLGPAPTIDNEGKEVGQVGTWGVVRNHIYDATLTDLAGLGTPVYDPSEIIHPQHPDVDETYIAARINILSWRIVSQDVSLKW